MSVDVITFGCRLNAFESEVIAARRSMPDLTTRRHQQLRRHQRSRGAGAAIDPAAEARAAAARIVVTGCAAQTQPAMFAEMAEVDRVIGNDGKMRSEAWRDARAAFDARLWYRGQRKDRGRRHHGGQGDGAASARRFQGGLPRVFVQVQNGCDHRCTFCIIPFGRGNSRSVPMGAVVDQVRALFERVTPRSC